MLNNIFGSIFSTTSTASSVSLTQFAICTVSSLVLGIVITLCFMYRSHFSKSFALTLTIIPAIVQVVIMLVNGNIGAGVAVAGAFSLVRFRSVPGNAKEIASIFLAMSVGLATGMGCIGIAVAITVIISLVSLIFTFISFGAHSQAERILKITIPENLDYNDIFDDLFATYLKRYELVSVQTSHMGSLFKLTYQIVIKDASKEKEMIDAIRCRNGNLDIVCSKVDFGKDSL